MKDLKTFAAFPIFALMLAGCGGGSDHDGDSGSGGNPAPDSVFELEAVQSFDALPKPVYEGSTEQAELNHPNALHFAHALHELADYLYAPMSDLGIREPRLLYNSESSPLVNLSDPLCQNGSTRSKNYRYDTRVFSVLTFDTCETETGTVHGQIIVGAYRNRRDVEVTYHNLALSAQGEQMIISGVVRFDGRRVYTDGLTASNSSLDATYYTDNLTLHRGGIEGTIAHSLWGKVEVESALSGRIQTIRGRSDSEQKLEFSGNVIQFELKINEGISLQTEMSPQQLSVWAYQNNEPVPPWDGEALAERDEYRLLSWDDMTDPDHDYLLAEWEYIASPGCSAEIQKEYEEHTLGFVASCLGDHILRFRFFDGVHTVAQDLVVSVVPPPVELISNNVQAVPAADGIEAQIETREHTHGSIHQYRIVQGPEGLNIDQKGVITGKLEQSRNRRGVVHVKVEIDNGRASVHDVAIHLPPTDQLPLIGFDHQEIVNRIQQPWGDIDGNDLRDQVIEWGNTFALREVTPEGTRLTYIETREFSPWGRLASGVVDINNDRQLDIVLVYKDRVVVLSGDDYRILVNRSFPGKGSSAAQALEAYLFTGEEPRVLVELEENDNRYWISYGIETGEYRNAAPLTSLYSPEAHDFDGDGRDELYIPAGSPIHGARIRHIDGSAWSVGLSNDIVDLDGNGSSDLVHVSGMNDESRAPQVTWRDDWSEKSSRTFRVNLVSYLIGEKDLEYAFAHLDGHPFAELLVAAPPGSSLYVHQVEDDTYEHTDTIHTTRLGALKNRLSQLDEEHVALYMGRQGELRSLSLTGPVTDIPPVIRRYGLGAEGAYPPPPPALYPFGRDSSGQLQLVALSRKGPGLITLNDDLDPINEQWFDNLSSKLQNVERQRPLQLNASGGAHYLFYPTDEGSYVVIDPSANGQIMAEGVVAGNPYWLAGDLNQDGLDEIYAITSREVYQLNPGDYQPEQVDVNPHDSDDYRGLIWHGRDMSSLIIYRDASFESGKQLFRYHMKGGELIRSRKVPIDFPSYSVRLAQQDTDGDGNLELILAEDGFTGLSLKLFNQELELIHSLSLHSTQAKYRIVDLPHRRGNSLVALVSNEGEDKPDGWRLTYLDPETGAIREQSALYPGEVEPFGVVMEGDETFVVTHKGAFITP